MGCGASLDNDSDSQASLEEWEKMQRRRRSILSDVSDAESDSSITFQKDIHEKALKSSGYQLLFDIGTQYLTYLIHHLPLALATIQKKKKNRNWQIKNVSKCKFIHDTFIHNKFMHNNS
ncbi:uncharacterized protein CDAR_228321 [Caerostris darwini]|uniref:Uncharacterized protein n=1 Tax=Caerostris darwini TaxID=1538125 RepID=A0AAV4N4J5_9ARAC|nr:uncharacterized protein CDAR_228321 [Caerostris darwini]